MSTPTLRYISRLETLSASFEPHTTLITRHSTLRNHTSLRQSIPKFPNSAKKLVKHRICNSFPLVLKTNLAFQSKLNSIAETFSWCYQHYHSLRQIHQPTSSAYPHYTSSAYLHYTSSVV